ncbi:Com family DNA-binding transcriptional regulator [Salmonella enterica subsp. enterica serovar Telelkebir]|nr:Com family DNA-binding transcriptional regulator [Salmonella enterica subsp. enterica serovar Telelkebir]ECC3295664.1 Com family DNA-binding transcriptional regulator [Salmonella enterica subsp. enterica]EDR2888319.1 Com family DNA-binding transcriptional regulator [Salmonella enterica subsp. enterica]EDR6140840.1 Com family DNA-binding transcriptional regulator [Salmonella enterica subsp. enterica]EDU9860162.1 Com family DNA-binding transcriptional regulator [Salmonella enterica subsp. ente
MTETRCLRCNKLLFKGRFISIQIKCSRCGYVNELSATPTSASCPRSKIN